MGLDLIVGVYIGSTVAKVKRPGKVNCLTIGRLGFKNCWQAIV
jgi:hypothetical protein